MGRYSTSKAQELMAAKLDALVGGRDYNPARFEVGREGVKYSISDISYREHKVVVYFDGCYWHECPEHCPLSRNGEVAHRDALVTEAILEQGWELFRVWEHDDMDLKAAEIAGSVAKHQQQLVIERVEHVGSHEARAWCNACVDWPHEPWPIDERHRECMRCTQPVKDHELVPPEWAPVIAKATVACREVHLADPLETLDKDELVGLADRVTATMASRIA